MNPLLEEILCCPIDRSSVSLGDAAVTCERGHRFPSVDGLPIMFNPELHPTHAGIFDSTRARASESPWQMSVDEARQYAFSMLGHTCGQFYHGARPADRLPIPRLPIRPGEGRFLDVGCGWGRWCMAAAQKGYTVVGIDPLLDSVRAAQALTRHLGVNAAFVVGDARCLPFKTGSFDVVHSYAVFLHFAKTDTAAGVREVGRVLRRGGEAFVQLPHAWGLRNILAQLSRGFRESPNAGDFSTRYWTRGAMRRLFEQFVGSPVLEAEGFGYTSAGGIPQGGLHGFPLTARIGLTVSDRLRRLSARLPPVAGLADSIYVHAIRDRDESGAGRLQ